MRTSKVATCHAQPSCCFLGTPEGLHTFMCERQMAFRPTQRIQLEVGDHVLLYTTRSIFRNPTRDLGRVVGTAVIASPVASLTSSARSADGSIRAAVS